MSSQLAGQLKPIVADAVAGVGFELDELEVSPAGRRKVVKAIVDSDDGIDLDEVATISRAVAAVLDEHEHLIAGTYTLEVTSPGTDRPLREPRHWRRAKHRLVRITRTDGTQLLARVGDAGQSRVRVLADGKVREIAYADVAKAAIEVEFRKPPAAELARLDEADSADTEADESGAGTGRTEPKEGPR